MGDEELLRLVLQGVRGFISYNTARSELPRAIRVVAEGHLWINRAILDKLPDYRQSLSVGRNDSRPRLTPREGAFVDMLQQRLSNKEIASKLAISERTVKFHLKNLFTKLGVHDRYSAADLAREIRVLEEGKWPSGLRQPVG
jgi:DNA-binding NarL/FixJ family response regulator